MAALALAGAAVVVTSVPRLAAQAPAPAGPRVVKIVGEGFKLVLRDDGTVVGFGLWERGQLGPVAGIGPTGQRTDRLIAIELPGKAIDIAAGTNTSFALLADGSVVGWGSGDGGELGVNREKRPLLPTSTQSMEYRGFDHPVQIRGLASVVAIAASGESAYAVLADGTVRAWGRENIGDGRAPRSASDPPNTKGPALTPVAVPGLANIVSVSAASGAVLALAKDGRVFSWGGNFYCMLGRPPRDEFLVDTPGEVPGLGDVTAVVAGPGVATALKRDGTVWVWGSNWMAQFGFGQRSAQPNVNGGCELVPQQVPGVANVVEIAVGTGRHTLARLRDGTLRFWGNNDWGQGGTGGGTGFVERPVVLKLNGVARIFAAGNNSYAVRTDGTFWAWGSGGRGEYPLTSNVRLPVQLDLR